MDADRVSHITTAGGWDHLEDLVIDGSDPVLASRWPIGEVAAVALGRVGAEASNLCRSVGIRSGTARVRVHDAAASLVGFALQRVDGKATERTNVENPFVGRYRCADGRWIFIHGGFPNLVDHLANVLNLPTTATVADIERVVRRWQSKNLEDLIANEGGCSAIIKTAAEWRAHPHGEAVHALPLVVETTGDRAPGRGWSPTGERPLGGLRVLDLTRVLAGPTCGRTLAALGADVLHVRGPSVPFVPAFVIDTGHGKRQAHCDFSDPEALGELRRVAVSADVVVQGYRPGVVEKYGLDEQSLRVEGFAGVYGSVSAYGPTGPWADRAGWEQLAQSTSGLCGDPLGDRKPEMLPAAVTDYTTGFVAAGAVVRAVADQLRDGLQRRVETSLCQTAAWFVRVGDDVDVSDAQVVSPTLVRTETEFGTLDHLGPCFSIDGLDIGWQWPTAPLGSGSLTW